MRAFAVLVAVTSAFNVSIIIAMTSMFKMSFLFYFLSQNF